jgi:transcriptional regulator with XRE-family HTH domain
MENENDDKPIRPTDLAGKLDISVAYASQLLSGARVPSLALSIDIFDRAGIKLGPIKEKSDEQIATLREALAA